MISSLGNAQPDNFYNNGCIQSPDTLDGMTVFRVVEKQPEYEGGFTNFYKEISKLIKFPDTKKAAIDNNYFFTFVVDTLGNIRNFCAIKPETGYLINQDGVCELNKWKAGEQRGKKVPVRMILPISIHLN
jgi:hypothetical protein